MADPSPQQNSKGATNVPPVNKACEPCRHLKVKCIPAISGPQPVCQRCLRFNRVCNFAAPHRKKQRKRTDARVAELEKEILAMRALLHKSRRSESSSSTKSSPQRTAVTPPQPKDVASSEYGANIAPSGFNGMQAPSESKLDIVDRGLLSLSEAQRLLDVYRDEYVLHFPLVPVKPHSTAEELRRTEPILFHAIMATACSKGKPSLYSTLSTEIMHEYCQQVMIMGQKSLQMVNAINCTSGWYFPTDRWASLKFYEYSHLAATVAVDIGLGDRDSVYQRDPGMSDADHQELVYERKRALVACYLQCASLSVALRRPNLIHFTPFMREIVSELELLPQPTAADKMLVAYVRLINIGEDIHVTFPLSDEGGEMLHNETKLQRALLLYNKKLSLWKGMYLSSNPGGDLTMMYHCMMELLHESPLHQYYPTTGFRPPFHLQGPSKSAPPLNATASQALCVCVSTSHAFIESFLGATPDFIRSMPNHLYARTVYSVLVLLMVALLPAPPSNAPPTEANTKFHRDLTRIEPYINAMIDKMVEAAGQMEYRIPCIFAAPLIKIRKWYQWSMKRLRRGEDTDGGLRFSMFAGPDDHPALLTCNAPVNEMYPVDMQEMTPPSINDSRMQSRDPSAPPEATARAALPPPGMPQNVTSKTPIVGRNEGVETDWMTSLEQDYSSMLDPANFDSTEFDFGDMAEAFQDLNAMNFSGPSSYQPVQQPTTADVGMIHALGNIPSGMTYPVNTDDTGIYDSAAWGSGGI